MCSVSTNQNYTFLLADIPVSIHVVNGPTIEAISLKCYLVVPKDM